MGSGAGPQELGSAFLWNASLPSFFRQMHSKSQVHSSLRHLPTPAKFSVLANIYKVESTQPLLHLGSLTKSSNSEISHSEGLGGQLGLGFPNLRRTDVHTAYREAAGPVTPDR